MGDQGKEVFRDSIGTITSEGKRQWIFPKKPKGKFYSYRTYISWVLLLCLFSFPFLKVNGNQFLLFNVLDRKFNIFGFPFWPQDFHLVVMAMIIGVIFVVLFTVIFGRIFCGWICPQTIFMEMVFRKIEYIIEGDRGAQIRLKKQPWNTEKIKKRVLKWIIFFIISFLIANAFLAYFIGGDILIQYIFKEPTLHISTLVSLLIFTTVFFFVFLWFREQVCIIACPYGRLQGVLLDNKTINIAYDYVRGEKKEGRAKFKKKEDRGASGKGDCIDCNQCVQVCPTGIDIRNGTQLECVNCTACIDACDFMMEKVNLPKGLIRYDSEDNINKGEKNIFTFRKKAYTAVLIVLMGIMGVMLFMRNDVEATLIKLPGQLYERTENNTISNVYSYKLVNKTVKDITNIEFRLLSHTGEVKPVGINSIILKKQALTKGTLFINIPLSELKKDREKIKIGIFSNNKKIETTTTNFLGPRKFR
ncbi:cytochrome c oxidase accessory protein CcoG [Pseudofulvibacter geojedonensis]|uniref:Cytochrome c oxidase accessory protein CcoG n=1 Tax=Pseudofulvibacter geojedonensis TaxID=1123758 RepID=A0ABW3I2P0_9FLAO